MLFFFIRRVLPRSASRTFTLLSYPSLIRSAPPWAASAAPGLPHGWRARRALRRSGRFDAAYDGGRRQSGWRSKGRERCRPAEPREALPPPCQASAGLFLEARVQQAEMWQSDLGRVAAPAPPSLLELALGDHALVVVEQRVRTEE